MILSSYHCISKISQKNLSELYLTSPHLNSKNLPAEKLCERRLLGERRPGEPEKRVPTFFKKVRDYRAVALKVQAVFSADDQKAFAVGIDVELFRTKLTKPWAIFDATF